MAAVAAVLWTREVVRVAATAAAVVGTVAVVLVVVKGLMSDRQVRVCH